MAAVRLPRIGLTGAGGYIGSVLREGLAGEYEIRPFTHGPKDYSSTVIELSRAEDLHGAFDGLSAVLHLGAASGPEDPWGEVLPANIIGTYNVFEEARRAGVERIIFASTNHVQNGRLMGRSTGEHDPAKVAFLDRLLRLDDPPWPDGFYGLSKLFGEDLGRLYHLRYGIRCVCLRIGWTFPQDDPGKTRGTPAEGYMRAMYLSRRDLLELFRRALVADVGFALAYGISNNGRRVFDLEETRRVLGFEPRDDAEDAYSSG